MYGIIKNVIGAGGYRLGEVLHKIDICWAEGKITDEGREELGALARTGSNAASEMDIAAKLTELEERIRALEAGSGDDTETAEYVPGKWYYTGDRVMWGGVEYECTAPAGTACVWSPAEYPAYWKEAAV